MFVKIDGETWVNLMFVSAVYKDGDQMKLATNDGAEWWVDEHHEPDVKKAMNDLWAVMMRFKIGSL